MLFFIVATDTGKMDRLKLLKTLANYNIRQFSTSSVCRGQRNFRSLPLYNFRGSREFRKQQETNPDPEIPVHTYGVRKPGYVKNGKFHLVPEMIPELIVPDLTNFTLKPYVSYKTSDLPNEEFTAEDLFNCIYRPKIENDFKNNKLDENDNPIEPSQYEKLTAEEARIQARKTGSDIFD